MPAVTQGARLGFDHGDEVLQCVDLDAGVNGQDIGHIANDADELKPFDAIVGHSRGHGGDHVGRRCPHEECVAVGCRLGHKSGANRGTTASFVFHHHTLRQLLTQAFGHHSREQIGGSSRGIGIDEQNGFIGVGQGLGIGGCHPRGQGTQEKGQQQNSSLFDHNGLQF